MRVLALLFVSLILASCGSTPVSELSSSGNTYRLVPANTYLVSFFRAQNSELSNSNEVFKHVFCPVAADDTFSN
ncbi:hypothetical protein [Breoghania sp.]|uniref:hypothetical protein n=1 Tax=Breoghania sp. TaxID=2065378 RepID=UPI00261C66E7|nr:hypothetical protein [Breoghania sp.]MDJ0931386.1 hypothetical protein [Breoghania sp.]